MCKHSCQAEPLTCGVWFSKVQSRSCSFWSTGRSHSAERGDGDPLGCPKESSQMCIPSAASVAQTNLLSHHCSSVSGCCTEVRLGWSVEGVFSSWPAWAPAQRHLKQFVQPVKYSTQSSWAWWYAYFGLKLDRSLKVLSAQLGPWRKYFCERITGVNITLECLLVVGLLCRRALGSQFVFSIAIS